MMMYYTNKDQQLSEYERAEILYGRNRLLRVARQNRVRAILSLSAAAMGMSGSVDGFNGAAPLMAGVPAFALSILFITLFLRDSYRLFQLRERRMAGVIEFLGRADQWWPRLPSKLSDMTDAGRSALASPATTKITYERGDRL